MTARLVMDLRVVVTVIALIGVVEMYACWMEKAAKWGCSDENSVLRGVFMKEQGGKREIDILLMLSPWYESFSESTRFMVQETLKMKKRRAQKVNMIDTFWPKKGGSLKQGGLTCLEQKEGRIPPRPLRISVACCSTYDTPSSSL